MGDMGMSTKERVPRPSLRSRLSSGRRGRGVRLAPAYHGSDRRWLEGKAPTPAPAAVDDTARHARDYATHAVRAGAAQLLFQLPSHMATFLLTLLAGAGATLASSVSRRAAIPAHVARGAVPAPTSRRRRRSFGFGSSSSHCRKPLAHTRRCCRLRHMWRRLHSRCLPALTPLLLLVVHAAPPFPLTSHMAPFPLLLRA